MPHSIGRGAKPYDGTEDGGYPFKTLAQRRAYDNLSGPELIQEFYEYKFASLIRDEELNEAGELVKQVSQDDYVVEIDETKFDAMERLSG